MSEHAISDVRVGLAGLDDQHRPEASVKVYLEWQWDPEVGPAAGRWMVAPVTVDGYPLDPGHADWDSASTCDLRPCNQLEWKAEHSHADAAGLPDAAELSVLLLEALDSTRRDG